MSEQRQVCKHCREEESAHCIFEPSNITAGCNELPLTAQMSTLKKSITLSVVEEAMSLFDDCRDHFGLTPVHADKDADENGAVPLWNRLDVLRGKVKGEIK